MMKSIKAIFAQDREAFRIPRRVQDTIPIKRVWPVPAMKRWFRCSLSGMGV